MFAAGYFGVRVILWGDPLILPVGVGLLLVAGAGCALPLAAMLAEKKLNPDIFIDFLRASIEQHPALLDQAVVIIRERITDVDKNALKGLKNDLGGFDARSRRWVRPPKGIAATTEMRRPGIET